MKLVLQGSNNISTGNAGWYLRGVMRIVLLKTYDSHKALPEMVVQWQQNDQVAEPLVRTPDYWCNLQSHSCAYF